MLLAMWCSGKPLPDSAKISAVGAIPQFHALGSGGANCERSRDVTAWRSMSSRRFSSPCRSSVTLTTVALALSACAGAGGEDDAAAGPPVFQGTQPAGMASNGSVPPGGASAPNAPSGGAGAGNPMLGGMEQQPGNIPVANGGAGGAAPVGTPEGTAGSAPVSGGAGGSAMTGVAGGAPLEPNPPDPPPAVDPFPAPSGAGCGPAAFFCEGFEDFAVGAAQQNAAWRPEGNVSIDDQAIEGTRALRLQPGGGQFARIALQNFSAPNSLFGRMFLRVEALPTSPNFAHWVVVEATGTGSSERVRPLGGQFIDLQDRGIRSNFWGVGADGGPTGDWTHWDNGGLVEARSATWECIEWRMNGADSAIDVWIDEQFEPSMSVTRDDNPRGVPFVFPTFNNLTIGWGVFQGGTTPGQFDVHIDDIVLSRERAGCN